jgi:hypothetical protein
MWVSLISSNLCGGVNSFRSWDISNILDGLTCAPTYEERVYPNPADDQATLQFTNSKGIKKVIIFNFQQQKVMESQVIDQGNIILSLQGLPEGMYAVHIEENGRKSIKRLSIKK